MWWFLNFFRMYKELPLNAFLNDKKRKFHMIEITPSDWLSSNHFIHATQLNKLNLEKIYNFYNKKSHLVINNELHDAYYYYKTFKKMGYKNLYILKK